MAGDDGASANIESLNAALAEAEIKAAAGDKMYLVHAKFLREKLASITIPPQQPEPADLPQSMRMAALNTAHTEAKEKTKSEEKSTPKNFGGDTQVTVVHRECDTQPDCVADATQLAGASPHAPHPPKTGRSKIKGQKDTQINVRIPTDIKAMLEAKAAAVKSYPSAYVLQLIAADLRIPIDEAALQRGRMLGDEIAALAVAINRQGNNFNQISKSAHEGKPCALSRPEISQTLQQHTAAVSAILRIGFG
jgi:DNA-binding protein YbaB